MDMSLSKLWETAKDREAWHAAVNGVTKSLTPLSNFHFPLSFWVMVCRRIDAFELWCWRRLMRVPWTARRSNQSILKEISPEYSLEGLMLKLKLQYFDQFDVKNWLTWKDPDAGKDWGQEEKGMTEDEIVGWHHQLDRHEFEQTLGDSGGQGSLACCSQWDHKESDTTEWLNWTGGWIYGSSSYHSLLLL